MEEKVCPIFTAKSEFKELCLGEECAWYKHCFPFTVTYTPQPQYPIDEPQYHPPSDWRWVGEITAGSTASQGIVDLETGQPIEQIMEERRRQ